jgi:hypothetical protein
MTGRRSRGGMCTGAMPRRVCAGGGVVWCVCERQPAGQQRRWGQGTDATRVDLGGSRVTARNVGGSGVAWPGTRHRVATRGDGGGQVLTVTNDEI